MRNHILTLALAVIISWLMIQSHNPQNNSASAAKETAYERVMRTGVIRCGYFPYAPALIKDPNTGEFSGIFYDTIIEMGRRLNLEIKMAEEVGYGVIPEGFKTGRYDAFCNTVWPTPERSRAASFSMPLYYSPVIVMVRANEHRFSDNQELLNNVAIKFSIKDGDVSASYAESFFSQSSRISIPQLADTSQLLDDVAKGKSDAVINSLELFYQYLEKNPDSLKELSPGNPIQSSANTFMLPPNDYQLKMMFDVTLQDLHNTGFIEKTIRKYVQNPSTVYRVAKPYQSPPVHE